MRQLCHKRDGQSPKATPMMPDGKTALVSCQVTGHTYKETGDGHVEIPNYLNRQFNIEALNQVWCSGVIYIWTGSHCAYLSVVIDLYARISVASDNFAIT